MYDSNEKLPQPLRECPKCHTQFHYWETAEEMLLQAIFGEGPLCKKCTRIRDEALPYLCNTCGKAIEKDKEVFFNDRPYHTYCLPHSD
ncbi:hypothetical protein LCGC14_1736210 [marine sediment metagenome]|uniref:Uncharacterized protein n=1 Tax=marine sediment metagenome TaxID=412755 RepID=A0A0F9H822_9ZZZZ